MPEIEIFRAGRHTAANGTTLTFSQTDLEQIASGYNPEYHEAPIVLGHPADNAPAYGWVKGLRVAGDRLLAQLGDLSQNFVEAVRNKLYRKVSASFYPPESPANPNPGQYSLRHLGFLGAQPPAVKGLKPFNLSEGDELDQARAVLATLISFAEDDAVEFEDCVDFASAKSKLMDEEDDEDKEDNEDNEDAEDMGECKKKKGSPASMCDCPECKAKKGKKPSGILYSENSDTEATRLMDATIEQRLKEIEKREQALALKEAAALRSDLTHFCEADLKGKVTPAMAATGDLVDFMVALNKQGDAVSFSEGDSTLLDWFKGFLGKLPQQVNFEEVVKQQAEEFAEASLDRTINWDKESVALDQRIRAYCKSKGLNPDNTADYGEAMDALGVTF